MINLFGLVIATNKEINKIRAAANLDGIAYGKKMSVVDEPKQELHCGYKSCQFHTTDPKGLKIHRARVHRKK